MKLLIGICYGGLGLLIVAHGGLGSLARPVRVVVDHLTMSHMSVVVIRLPVIRCCWCCRRRVIRRRRLVLLLSPTILLSWLWLGIWLSGFRLGIWLSWLGLGVWLSWLGLVIRLSWLGLGVWLSWLGLGVWLSLAVLLSGLSLAVLLVCPMSLGLGLPPRLVGESENGSDGGVGERVTDPVVLAQVLVLQRRIQVFELDSQPALAIDIPLVQVVVQPGLGGVQVVLVIVVIVAAAAMMVIAVTVVMIVLVLVVVVVITAASVIVVASSRPVSASTVSAPTVSSPTRRSPIAAKSELPDGKVGTDQNQQNC